MVDASMVSLHRTWARTPDRRPASASASASRALRSHGAPMLSWRSASLCTCTSRHRSEARPPRIWRWARRSQLHTGYLLRPNRMIGRCDASATPEIRHSMCGGAARMELKLADEWPLAVTVTSLARSPSGGLWRRGGAPGASGVGQTRLALEVLGTRGGSAASYRSAKAIGSSLRDDAAAIRETTSRWPGGKLLNLMR